MCGSAEVLRGLDRVTDRFRITASTIALLAGWTVSGSAILAAGECGPGLAGTVTCSSDIGNYPNGITYNSPLVSTLVVEGGTIIRPLAGGTDAVNLFDGGGSAPLMVNLAKGVTIDTHGRMADGVLVAGNNGITIISAADISVTYALGLPLSGAVTSAVAGDIGAGGSGDVTVIQLAGSRVTAIGTEVTGLYGISGGAGSVLVTAAGTVSVTGESAYGLNADGAGPDIATIVAATGVLTVNGYDSVGLYSLNHGVGNARAIVHGKVTTVGDKSPGLIAYVTDPAATGQALAGLSQTGSIHTSGDQAYGALVGSKSLGGASAISAGTVTTQGSDAHGLYALIDNAASNAAALVQLDGPGSVLTNGTAAHGLFANHLGQGASIITMGSGTSVVTTGDQASGARALIGVDGTGGTTVSFTQAAGARIAVSGTEAYGVDLLGTTQVAAAIGGAVTASGQFGVGASALSTAGDASVTIGSNGVVIGGWQADIAGLGGATAQPSAGILIGGPLPSQLNNWGIIGAGSDRAIADGGRQTLTPGDLQIDNGGTIVGFVDLAGGGANRVSNAGLFDIRHFADTDGDGIRDIKRVAISDFGASTSSFANAAGGVVRLAPVVSNSTTDATGFYIPTTGAGSRALEAAHYTLDRAGIVQGQFTNLGLFANTGTIDLRGPAIGNVLVLTDNSAAGGVPGSGIFRSDGGALLLNTMFTTGIPIGGQTGSLSDVLVVDRTLLGAGATAISIGRRAGPGGLTPGNGILLVEVRDKAASAAGAFTLNGDFVVDGQQMTIGGAYRYGLFHNGVAGDSSDGNWYLRGLGLSPTVPVYEAYPKILLPLLDLPTLQQRVGNRFWLQQGEAQTAVTETTGLWGRVRGGYGHYAPPQSSTGGQYDAAILELQVGLDRLISERENGTFVGGLSINHVQSAATIAAPGGDGNIASSTFGLGGTLTWHGAEGFYVDAQAQLGWLGSELSSLTTGRSLVDGNAGFGHAFSLEAGQRFELDEHWTLTPQAQLHYAGIGFDSFADPYDTQVTLVRGQSLRGRLGLAAAYQSHWTAEDGTLSRLKAYGIANLEQEFLGGTRVSISGHQFSSGDSSLWGGIGLGGSYNWNDDRYSVYGEALANTALAPFGGSFELGGTVGMRVEW